MHGYKEVPCHLPHWFSWLIDKHLDACNTIFRRKGIVHQNSLQTKMRSDKENYVWVKMFMLKWELGKCWFTSNTF